VEVVLEGDGLHENAEEESGGEEVADDGRLGLDLGELDEQAGGGEVKAGVRGAKESRFVGIFTRGR
jgi:hypothetical protein